MGQEESIEVWETDRFNGGREMKYTKYEVDTYLKIELMDIAHKHVMHSWSYDGHKLEVVALYKELLKAVEDKE